MPPISSSTATATPPHFISSLRWLEAISRPCWTSSANLSCLSSLRCILSTKSSELICYRIHPLGNGRQISVNCELHQPGHVVDIEFSHQTRPVSINRFRAKIEPCCDLLGANPVHQKRKNLVFARTQRVQWIGVLGVTLGEKELLDLKFGRKVDSAERDLAQCFK